jgi:hypothetical protein
MQLEASWGRNIHKIPSQLMARYSGIAPVIPAMRESINRRFSVQAGPRKK